MWELKRFLFPRKLDNGTWSRWGELLAYRELPGGSSYRRPTPTEADERNSARQIW